MTDTTPTAADRALIVAALDGYAHADPCASDTLWDAIELLRELLAENEELRREIEHAFREGFRAALATSMAALQVDRDACEVRAWERSSYCARAALSAGSKEVGSDG